MRPIKSVTSSARKLNAIRNGESSSSGSARTIRVRKAISGGAQAHPAAKFYPSGRMIHGELLRKPPPLFLQAKRPRGALFKVLFHLVQRGYGQLEVFYGCAH